MEGFLDDQVAHIFNKFVLNWKIIIMLFRRDARDKENPVWITQLAGGRRVSFHAPTDISGKLRFIKELLKKEILSRLKIESIHLKRSPKPMPTWHPVNKLVM